MVSVGEIVFSIYAICFALEGIAASVFLIKEIRFIISREETRLPSFVVFSNAFGIIVLFLVCWFEVYFNLILALGATLKDYGQLPALFLVAFGFHHFIAFLLLTALRELQMMFSSFDEVSPKKISAVYIIFWIISIGLATFGWVAEFRGPSNLVLIDYFGTKRFVNDPPNFLTIIPTILSVILVIAFSLIVALFSCCKYKQMIQRDRRTIFICSISILVGNVVGLILNAVPGQLQTFLGNGVEIITILCYLIAERALFNWRQGQKEQVWSEDDDF
jgi:hypothetical protein